MAQLTIFAVDILWKEASCVISGHCVTSEVQYVARAVISHCARETLLHECDTRFLGRGRLLVVTRLENSIGLIMMLTT